METTTTHADVTSAQRIFDKGSDFISLADMYGTLGVKGLPPQEQILYSPEQMQKAREVGLMLVNMMPDMTMKGIMERVNNQTPDGKKLLYNTDWYNNEAFFTTTKTHEGAYFVALNGLPDSNKKNYLQQTKMLADWVKAHSQLSVNPTRAEQYAEDFYSKEANLAKLLRENWQKAGQQLAELEVNQNCREKACEMTLRLLSYMKVNNVRLHASDYAWLADVTSGSRLVLLGCVDVGGADVSDWRARYSDGCMFLVPRLQ